MKRLGSLGAVLPFLALAATACGANTDQLVKPEFKFSMLADFEKSGAFNIPAPTDAMGNPLWAGGFAGDADTSMVLDPAKFQRGKVEAITPERVNPDMTVSTQAFHMADAGYHTYWGTVMYADLQTPIKPVDLSRFKGISLWARSAAMPGFTVKVALADLPSFDFGQIGAFPENTSQLCNARDTTVGGLGCYDDYAVKIYPDGVWRRYDIPFASMATGGWGLIHPFDLVRVMRVKLSMLPGTAYDLWFDDIAFYTD